jgi:hypothetical protein
MPGKSKTIHSRCADGSRKGGNRKKIKPESGLDVLQFDNLSTNGNQRSKKRSGWDRSSPCGIRELKNGTGI